MYIFQRATMARSDATNLRGRLSACCGQAGSSSHCCGLVCSRGGVTAAGVFGAGPAGSCSCLCSAPMAGAGRREYKGQILLIFFRVYFVISNICLET